mmetsp:Transcript_7330/g.16669  ORF Transcript_7330/g.16669 Transcript_7330/m.16669 type:complete len:218 (-) Transcript_7330:2234-2887(-)
MDSLSSFCNCWILWVSLFCSSSFSSLCWRFVVSSVERLVSSSSSWRSSVRNASSLLPSSSCATRCASRSPRSFFTSFSNVSLLCPDAWSVFSCDCISFFSTSNSTFACSVFSRCFSSLSMCCFAAALNCSTCCSRCLILSSRLESRLLISFSNCLTDFSSCFFSSGNALMSASNWVSCACDSFRACSAAWCSLRLMRSSISSSSCSLHFSSRSTPSN